MDKVSVEGGTVRMQRPAKLERYDSRGGFLYSRRKTQTMLLFLATIIVGWQHPSNGFIPQNEIIGSCRIQRKIREPIVPFPESWKGNLRLSIDDDRGDDGDDSSNSSSSSDEDDTIARFDAEQLSNRIREVERSESEVLDQFTSGIQQRIRELQSAEAIEEQFENESSSSSSALLSLPVICFDALLPNQKLEGSTEDPTFIRFLLEETGLGGWFVMVSFEYRSRKVRRNGVLCKVEFLDAAAKTNAGDDEDDGYSVGGPSRKLPTSVRFVIAGKRRCRVAGEEKALQLRIGRWRRQYDENGEESVLGWGVERFTDLLPAMVEDSNSTNTRSESPPQVSRSPSTREQPTDPRQWSKTEIESKNLEGDAHDYEYDKSTLDKAESLVPYVEEWYDLASNAKTYHNTNVTVTARVQRDQPMLRVDPNVLLKKVRKELGDRPDPRKDPHGFCFWAGALINPLPALGVSLEIRGNLLEVRTLEERLKIIELGLLRSIQNLKGEPRATACENETKDSTILVIDGLRNQAPSDTMLVLEPVTSAERDTGAATFTTLYQKYPLLC
eukprot:jgi/Psemu1/49069/gm1.49069_g